MSRRVEAGVRVVGDLGRAHRLKRGGACDDSRYDVHVTRREDWSDMEGPDISEAEWRSVVEADPELRLVGVAEAPVPAGDVLRYESPDLVEWSAIRTRTSCGWTSPVVRSS